MTFFKFKKWYWQSETRFSIFFSSRDTNLKHIKGEFSAVFLIEN